MSIVNLENKTILVTGAAGFIGSNLALRLLKEINGVKVIGIDKYIPISYKDYFVEQVESYLQVHPAKYGGMIDSLIEFIYMNYTECNPVEDDRIRQLDAQLYKRFTSITGSADAADELMNMVSNICSEYERISYMEGIRVGARLVLELMRE